MCVFFFPFLFETAVGLLNAAKMKHETINCVSPTQEVKRLNKHQSCEKQNICPAFSYKKNMLGKISC